MADALGAGVAGRIADAAGGLAGAARAVHAHGPWAAALVLLAGVAALTVVARSRRALALLGGAALGALAALAARGWLQAHVGLAAAPAAAIGVAAGAAVGGAWPGAFHLLAGAVLGAILGAGVPLSGRPALGALAGAAVGSLVGLAAGRAAAAAVASVMGGALVAVGGVALLGAHPIAAELAGRPFALAAIALVLGIAGAAYQLSGASGAPRAAPPPAERARPGPRG